jgi:hypothetical protein
LAAAGWRLDERRERGLLAPDTTATNDPRKKRAPAPRTAHAPACPFCFSVPTRPTPRPPRCVPAARRPARPPSPPARGRLAVQNTPRPWLVDSEERVEGPRSPPLLSSCLLHPPGGLVAGAAQGRDSG